MNETRPRLMQSGRGNDLATCGRLRLVAEGYTNAPIAHELSIAERTVAFHVSNVLEKLDAESRIDASMWAKDRGIVA